MYYLYPWFVAIDQSPSAFQVIMDQLGFEFDQSDLEWVTKASVIAVVNKICGVNITQRRLWQLVRDAVKPFPDDLKNSILKADPLYKRNRNWCHLNEAWFAAALMCSRNLRLHVWLYHFNLSPSSGTCLKDAKQIIFDGKIKINGILVEGSGVVKLSWHE